MLRIQEKSNDSRTLNSNFFREVTSRRFKYNGFTPFVSKNAFSLMEMMIVLLIVAVVAAVSAPMVNRKMVRAASEKSPWVWVGNRNVGLIAGDDQQAFIGGMDGNGKLSITTGDARAQIELRNGPNNINLQYANHNILIGAGLLDGENINNGIGLGEGANVGTSAIAIGNGTSAQANSIAIGRGATANAQNSVAIGSNVANGEANTIRIGSNGQRVVIPNGGLNIGGVPLTVDGNTLTIGDATHTVVIPNLRINALTSSDGDTYLQFDLDTKRLNLFSPVTNALFGTDGTQYLQFNINNRTLALKDPMTDYLLGTDGTLYLHFTHDGTNRRLNLHNPTSNALFASDGTQYLQYSNPGAPRIDLNADVLVASNFGVEWSSHLGRREGAQVLLRGCYWENNTWKNRGVYRFTGFWDKRSDSDSEWTMWGFPDFPYSDSRLKNVGKKYEGGLEELKKLDLYHYTFKNDKARTPRVGVMAQDLQKIFPDAVTEGQDGYLMIRWEDMFYAVINAVKELDTKIVALVDRVTGHDKAIEELTAQNKVLEQENKALKEQLQEIDKRLAKLEKQKSKRQEEKKANE